VWLDEQLLAVVLYKKGSRASTAAITTLSTHHGKEVHDGIQAARELNAVLFFDVAESPLSRRVATCESFSTSNNQKRN